MTCFTCYLYQEICNVEVLANIKAAITAVMTRLHSLRSRIIMVNGSRGWLKTFLLVLGKSKNLLRLQYLQNGNQLVVFLNECYCNLTYWYGMAQKSGKVRQLINEIDQNRRQKLQVFPHTYIIFYTYSLQSISYKIRR